MLLKNQETKETLLSREEITRRETILREAFERDGHKLRTAILVFTRDPDAAEDVFQETFLRALEKAGRFDPNVPNASAIAWLKAVAHNIIRNRWRKENTAGKYFLPVAETSAVRDFSTDDDFSEAALFDLLKNETNNEREIERAQNAVVVLTEEEREILELRFLDGLSSEETATRFGISSGAVDMRVCRAKNKLRKALNFDQGK